jgi:hypothetical protein
MSGRRGLTIAELIMRRGDIAARGAERSGQIWGNALANLGNIAGGAIQQHGQRKEAEQRSAAIDTIMQDWDGEDLQSLSRDLAPHTGLERALEIANGMGTLRSTMEKLQKKEVPTLEETQAQLAALGAIEKSTPGYLQRNYEPVIGIMGPGLQANLGFTPPPQWEEGVTQQLLAVYDQMHPSGTTDVTTTGPAGGPVRQAFTQEQMAEGVPVYQEPEQTGEQRQAQIRADATTRAQVAQQFRPPKAPPDTKRFEGMSSDLRSAMNRAVMSLSGPKHKNVMDTIAYAWGEADEAEVKSLIVQAAVEGENVEMKNRIRGRMGTVAALKEARRILEAFQEKGVDTGVIRGGWENFLRKLGTSSNPEFVALQTQLKDALITYRRAATGVQFSVKESQEYERMFPNYSQELPTNLAAIKGLERAMRVNSDSYWRFKLGEDGAKLVGAIDSKPWEQKGRWD